MRYRESLELGVDAAFMVMTMDCYRQSGASCLLIDGIQGLCEVTQVMPEGEAIIKGTQVLITVWK